MLYSLIHNFDLFDRMPKSVIKKKVKQLSESITQYAILKIKFEKGINIVTYYNKMTFLLSFICFASNHVLFARFEYMPSNITYSFTLT